MSGARSARARTSGAEIAVAVVLVPGARDVDAGRLQPRRVEHRAIVLAAGVHQAGNFLELERAVFRVALGIESVLRRHGDDVDHARQRVGAPQRRLRPAQDLDAVDGGGQQMREVEFRARLRGVVGAHAVDEHQRVARLGAADADLRDRAHGAAAAHLDAGHLAQRVEDLRDLVRLQRCAVDHRNCAAGLVGGDGHAAGGDDDFSTVSARAAVVARRNARNAISGWLFMETSLADGTKRLARARVTLRIQRKSRSEFHHDRPAPKPQRAVAAAESSAPTTHPGRRMDDARRQVSWLADFAGRRLPSPLASGM